MTSGITNPDSVNDMCVVNTDAKSHSGKTPKKCLKEVERGKRQMYLVVCLRQRRDFSPFVALMDVLLGVEATTTLKRTASRLDTKWWKPYLRTCGYVNSRIAITLVCTTHTGASEYPGCRRIVSDFSVHSGKTTLE